MVLFSSFVTTQHYSDIFLHYFDLVLSCLGWNAISISSQNTLPLYRKKSTAIWECVRELTVYLASTHLNWKDQRSSIVAQVYFRKTTQQKVIHFCYILGTADYFNWKFCQRINVISHKHIATSLTSMKNKPQNTLSLKSLLTTHYKPKICLKCKQHPCLFNFKAMGSILSKPEALMWGHKTRPQFSTQHTL